MSLVSRMGQRVATLPPARKAIALLPPAASLLPTGHVPFDRLRAPWLDAAWRRHRVALGAFSEGGVTRHNAAVKVARRKVERFADGAFARAASTDLGRLARASERPVYAVVQGVEAARKLAARRPSLAGVVSAYEAVKHDPNAVRRWLKGLADWMPTF